MARKLIVRLTCCFVTSVTVLPAAAADRDIVMIQASPDVIHYHPSSEHAEWSWAVGVEWQRPSRWLLGFVYFNNSFNQKSQYYYLGHVWNPIDRDPNWYLKLTGGLVYGYTEPYEDKVPYNHDGYSPGIVPAVGRKWERWSLQLNILGTAGLMISGGYDLIR
jgi:hypothetical protein